MPRVHRPGLQLFDAQSAWAPHSASAAHGGHSPPPQSTAVSRPLRRPSPHVARVGWSVGVAVGARVGRADGCLDGARVARALGTGVGTGVGWALARVGARLGAALGAPLGASVLSQQDS